MDHQRFLYLGMLHPPANRAVKLSPLWTTNLRSWFTSAEGAFRLRNIADEESRFYNCLHALPEAGKQALGARADLFAALNSKHAHDAT
jgi:hypothetical protein